MGRKPKLPPGLLTGPFRLDAAKRAGIGRAHLRGASWKRIGPATYAPAQLDDDPMHDLEAASFRLPDCAVFSGLTAAWLHGIDVDPVHPIEATVPDDAGISARAGLELRRATLDKVDVVHRRGFRATSIARTIADLSARLSLTEAVVIADAALHAGVVRIEHLESWAIAHARRRGIRKLRQVIELAEPASESPMETRLRMVLERGCLPRPRAQVSIHDGAGQFVGRPDLYYQEQRLGIEYDGDVHRSALAADNQRQNRLLNVGVRLLRFTASDVFGNPAGIVAQVRAELQRAPANGGYLGPRMVHSPAVGE